MPHEGAGACPSPGLLHSAHGELQPQDWAQTLLGWCWGAHGLALLWGTALGSGAAGGRIWPPRGPLLPGLLGRAAPTFMAPQSTACGKQCGKP